ncbi:MAG: hypothetical protein PSY12_08385 [bacterium]|nr:hypothetical protein [bacterium]
MHQPSYGSRFVRLRDRLAQALLRDPAVVLLERDGDDTALIAMRRAPPPTASRQGGDPLSYSPDAVL